jgi:hypothetical protein
LGLLGFEVDVLGELRELLVGLFFFVESLAEQ